MNYNDLSGDNADTLTDEEMLEAEKYLVPFMRGELDKVPVRLVPYLRSCAEDAEQSKAQGQIRPDAELLRMYQEGRQHDMTDAERQRLHSELLKQDAPAAGTATAANERASEPGCLAPPRTFADIPDPIPENQNPRALFRNGWLRKGGTAYIIAPSGVGKSVITNQLLYCWAIGKAGCGPEPVRSLKIALIQAEDDTEEMGEFRDNLREGFRQSGWTDEQISAAEKSVCEESHNFAGLTGARFVSRLIELQRARHYDLVVINPLQSYTGFDISRNSELSYFLRDQSGEGLDSVSKGHDTECGILVVHHTNKPPTAEADKKAWGDEATAAYIGAGGAELVNHARAIMVIRREAGEDVFSFLGAKRGKRIGWTDESGKKVAKKSIGYSKDIIFWRELTGDELPKQKQKPGRVAEGDATTDALELSEWVKANPSTRTKIRAHAIAEKPKGGFGKCRGQRAYDLFIHSFGEYGLTENIVGGYARIGTKEALDGISRNAKQNNSGN